jgi:tetratricopeptide (TPR) repeat protein
VVVVVVIAIAMAMAPAAHATAVLRDSPSPGSVVELLDRLSAAPDDEVAELVAGIEAASAAPGELASSDRAALPDALFTAARACEERLLDPSRALALYERILATFPDARVAVAAARRARHLREQVGLAGRSSDEALAFAHLVADGERLQLSEALRRADALAARDWTGAAEVLLWSAELVRRRGSLSEAMARYRRIVESYPGTASAIVATRGLAGVAVEQGDWVLAEQMARALPIADPADVITRDELLAKVAVGRTAARWVVRARLVLAATVVLLLISLLHVTGWRHPLAWFRALYRPPLEVLYMAPVAAVMIGASLTAHTSIAPAVTIISLGGMALSWLSGSVLSEARRRERETRWRSFGHVAITALAAVALAYLAVTRTDLLEMLIATVQMGPEP